MSDPEVIKATVPASDWLANPDAAFKAFTDTLVAIPDQHHWVAIGSAILGGLYAVGRFAPVVLRAAPFLAGVPIVGQVLGALSAVSGFVANVTWKASAHADQKEEDAIKNAVHEAAKIAAPFLKALKATDIKYPDAVAELATPEVAAAIQRLAAEA